MYEQFLQEIKQHLEINEDRTIPKRDSRKILEATKNFLIAKDPKKVKAIEDKFGMTIYALIKDKVLPLSVVMMAQGQFTVETFLDKILEKDKDTKIIIDFIDDKDFLKAVDEDFYRIWHSVDAKPLEVNVGGLKLTMPTESQTKVIDTVLESAGIKSSYKDIYNALGSVDELEKERSSFEKMFALATKEKEELKKKLHEASTAMASLSVKDLEVEGTGEIPNGKMVMKKITDVFPGVFNNKMTLEIPTWEWDGPHPMVPKVQSDYIFREDLLLRVLYAIIKNKRMYLHGHTGSGKTTLIEQVAAYLGWPTIRINFDSEITRMDLIGRDTLINDGTGVTSKFQEGLLPQMMTQPCVGIFDEIDFCRPDVAYVMQAALENNSLRLTEDGGREVKPHPMFRMFATGNTVGQGDEMGMYQGARPQSLAFLDRFTIWAKVDYLDSQQREKLIKDHAPALDDETVKVINKYSTEHIEGFLSAKVLQPLSPRGILAVADSVSFYTACGVKNPLKEALYTTVLDRATTGDYAVLKGIIDRVAK